MAGKLTVTKEYIERLMDGFADLEEKLLAANTRIEELEKELAHYRGLATAACS